MNTVRTLFLGAALLASPALGQSEVPVTVTESPTDYVLANGVVTARVLKRNGDLASLKFRDVEMLNDRSGHAGAYWSHDTTGGAGLVSRVTIDPAATMTEARFAAKLADTFDWMTVDAHRDKHFPATLREGDKYIYTANQFDNRAFGWSSTKDRLGFWLINPSVEFLSGGPTKTEFLAHRDTTPVAAPIVFNYWRSSHYGGAAVEIGAGERWSKVIGPFFLYVNSGGDPAALAADARTRQVKEASQWPYEWVEGVDYARRAERTTVKGRLELVDPFATNKALPNLLVGLTPATWTSPVQRTGPGAAALPPRQIDWQIDAKHYQFWARGEDDGAFSVPHVPAGTYTLRALADGVLGEFARADVVVKPGQPLDLGTLAWKPVRRGRPVWEVGVPNRTATEFAGADQFWLPEMPLKYATLFPNGVNFVIGKSEPARDWFFQHVPHNDDPAAKSVPYRGITNPGRATPFNISFDLPASPAPKGKATLRVAICGGGAREIAITVNGQPAGKIDRLLVDGAITRHSIRGLWYQRDLPFDATLLKPGLNTLTLTVPAGPVNNGVIYDYLRLELDESVR